MNLGLGLNFLPLSVKALNSPLRDSVFLGTCVLSGWGGMALGVCTLTWIFFLSQVAEAHRRRAGSGLGEPHSSRTGYLHVTCCSGAGRRERRK